MKKALKTYGVMLSMAIFTLVAVFMFIFAACESPDELTVVTSVAISISAPVNGGTPVTTASTTDIGYTLGAVSWLPADNPFLGGKVYIALLTLTADSGYTFTGLNSVTINGQTTAVLNNTGTSVRLSYTFPATDTRKVITGIAIKTQPTKLIYTHGEALDLSGLVVTLTYADTTTEDVTAASFAARNITATPSRNANLVYVTHNGQPVTITYGNLPPLTTSNLTVNKALSVWISLNPINVTYITTLQLSDLTLPNGYEWNAPSTSLNAGNGQIFEAIYTQSANHNPVNDSITVNVAKAAGATVNAPVLDTKTHNSITINPVTASTGQAVQYAIHTISTAPVNISVWQTDTTFADLNNGTTYYVFARAAGNDNYETGAASISLTVLMPQAVPPNRVEYYWVNEHGSLVTTSGGAITVASGGTLTITAQGTDYDVKQWNVNGINTGESGDTYNFSSWIIGNYIVSLFVEKDGKLYITNITITVEDTIFFENFEGTSSFILVNGSQTNQWIVGAATAYGGNNSAYISNNNGTSNAYTITSSSIVHMYRDVTFPASSVPYTLSFYWKCQGEGTSTRYDYLRIFLVNTTVTPTAGSTTSLGTALGTYNLGGTGWNHATISIPASNSGTTRRLVFTWVNDSSAGTQPPAAVDNIELRIN